MYDFVQNMAANALYRIQLFKFLRIVFIKWFNLLQSIILISALTQLNILITHFSRLRSTVRNEQIDK